MIKTRAFDLVGKLRERAFFRLGDHREVPIEIVSAARALKRLGGNERLRKRLRRSPRF